MTWAILTIGFLGFTSVLRLFAASHCYMGAKEWPYDSDMTRVLMRSYREHLVTSLTSLVLGLWGIAVIIEAM